MKITVLTENTSAAGLPAEHGLSLYIEAKGKTILFDTGQSDLFAKNAARLGADLRKVDFAVLSHGHYDHSGGVKTFLTLNDAAPVYLSSSAFETHLNADGRDIGVDPSLKSSDRLRFVSEATVLAEGIVLHTAQEVHERIRFGSAGLSVQRGGAVMPDDFRHEQYLVIEENGKTVLFSGCAHKGIVNIVGAFKPDIVFGGFHFMKHPLDGELRGFAKMLDAYHTAYYTCHCTGTEQYHFIKPYINNLRYISAGDAVDTDIQQKSDR